MHESYEQQKRSSRDVWFIATLPVMRFFVKLPIFVVKKSNAYLFA